MRKKSMPCLLASGPGEISCLADTGDLAPAKKKYAMPPGRQPRLARWHGILFISRNNSPHYCLAPALESCPMEGGGR